MLAEEKIIVLNNKCNFTKDEYEEYLQSLKEITDKKNLIVCPSSCYLSIKIPENIALGSQNVSINGNGAYTGEISATQLQSLNAHYCLVAHQEVRALYHENNKTINKKIKQLLENDITPILCIGETKIEVCEQIINDLEQELSAIFNEIEEEQRKRIIIAYEPAWAIGNNITEYISKIEEVLKKIKQHLPNNKLIYGGGIDEKNIKRLKNNSLIDGFLLGSLSLDIHNLKRLLEELEK